MTLPFLSKSHIIILLCAITFELKQINAEIDHEDVCQLYTRKNFSGEPVLTIRPSIKIFETSLIFKLPTSIKEIPILSVKLSKPNCSVILCNGKHLGGECTEIQNSTEDISSLMNKNVLSVDCHCSSSSKEVEENPSSQADGSVLHSSISEKVTSLEAQPCANLFRDWHFKGQYFPLLFPGSVAKVKMGSDPTRIRSIKVKDECKLTLWGNVGRHSSEAGNGSVSVLSIADSTSFLQPNRLKSFEWACCHCDTCSETVCNNAQASSATLSGDTGSTNNGDFSQFVEKGKKIIGIGRNYRWKKVELAKVLAIPKEPIVFLKPTTSYIKEGDLIELPMSLGTIFYELELGVVIGKIGRNISEADALDHVAGYFLALDMTAKEFIKGKGNQSHPWEIGKGYDTACPVGDFISKQFIPDPNDIHLECKVNGEVTQSENTSQMIFNVKSLISYVSRYMTLEPYDTILTGTPDGFGAVKEGDIIEGKLGNLTSITFTAIASDL